MGDAPETFNPASDDAEFEKKGKAKPARLYKFLDPNPIGEGKFIKQKLLLETECYLLIGPGLRFWGIYNKTRFLFEIHHKPCQDNQKVFSWKGKKSSKAQRKDLSVKFDDFLAQVKFTGTPSVEMLGQGTETATFKQLFVDWKAPDAADPLKKVQTGGRLAKSISGKFISSIFPTNIHIFFLF